MKNDPSTKTATHIQHTAKQDPRSNSTVRKELEVILNCGNRRGSNLNSSWDPRSKIVLNEGLFGKL